MCIIKCLVVFYLFQNFYTEVVILYKVWNKLKKVSQITVQLILMLYLDGNFFTTIKQKKN